MATIRVDMDAESKQRLIDRMEAIPITSTLRFRLDDLGDGMCRATVPYEKKFDGVFECFHGGLWPVVIIKQKVTVEPCNIVTRIG